MHLLLYDGVCGLCNRLNTFVIKRDRADRFQFAPLQGKLARDLLTREGLDARDLDTFYAIEDYGSPTQKIYARADAGLFVLREIGGLWKLALVTRVLPRGVRNWAYGLVARRRYRWFGQYDACLMPTKELRGKFIGLEE